MTGDELATFVTMLAFGALVAWALARLRLQAPSEALVRINLRGHRVPAVLGDAIVVSALTGLAILALVDGVGWHATPELSVVLATLLILVVFGVAGAWDDRKGDERPRGFKGHLGALKTGRVTGGLVKLLAGGLAGLAAGFLVFDGVVAPLQTGAIVALAANLANLLDRAPGRTGKACLIAAVPLVVAGSVDWSLAAAGSLGALAAVMPLDLGERGMLGDAGANPLGAVMGLGFALTFGPMGRWVILAILVALNAASERWSFSVAIESSKVLSRIDRAGRQP